MSYISSFIHQKRFYKNKEFNFRAKIYKVRKKWWEQNCSSQEDIHIYSRLLFDRTHSFCFNCKKRYQK